MSGTDEPDDNADPAASWSNDNQAHFVPASGWQSISGIPRMAVYGTPVWRTDEDDEFNSSDLPGAKNAARNTTGVITPGITSTGHTTEGLDTSHGLTGDYLVLDAVPKRTYRIEVTFGNSQDASTGGSAWGEYLDPAEGVNAVGCCNNDHNRDDGFTTIEFTDSGTRPNRRYLLFIAAFDMVNSDSATYHGPYEVTMTDITGARLLVGNLRLGDKVDSAAIGASSRRYAQRMVTNIHSPGFKIDRARALVLQSQISNR